jgi:hypothetical protein
MLLLLLGLSNSCKRYEAVPLQRADVCWQTAVAVCVAAANRQLLLSSKQSARVNTAEQDLLTDALRVGVGCNQRARGLQRG